MTRFFALATVLLSAQVAAQTYVRPSKGKALEIFKGKANTTVSATLDMTAFGAIQFTYRSNFVGAPSCSGSIGILGSNNPAGPFVELVTEFSSVDVAAYGSGVWSTNYEVPSLPSYIQFKPYTAGNCSVDLTATPIPFSAVTRPVGTIREGDAYPGSYVYPIIVGGSAFTGSPTPISMAVDTNGYVFTRASGRGYGLQAITPVPVAASPAASTAVVVLPAASNATQPYDVTLHNTGTQPVYCAAGPGAIPAAVTPSRYSVVLKAGTAANDGTGGQYTFFGFAGYPFTSNTMYIYCIAAVAGASSVAVNIR